jgi:hypothetical protein
MSKQSSVEWLFEQVCNLDWRNISGEEKLKTFEQAKEMHKEETENAWLDGMKSDNGHFGSSEDYYTKTFEQ